MRHTEIRMGHAEAYAKANNMKILSEIDGAVVVELANGSISNINAITVSDWINVNTPQEIKGGANIMNASKLGITDFEDTFVKDSVSDRLRKAGIDDNVKSYDELTVIQRNTLANQGISAPQVNAMIASRNRINDDKERQDYINKNANAQQKFVSEQAEKNSSDYSVTDEQRLDERLSSHGVSPSKAPTQRTVNEPINAANYQG